MGAAEMLTCLEPDPTVLSPFWADPAFRGQGTDSKTKFALADAGSLFPGAQLPKAHGKSLCRPELLSLLRQQPPSP